MKKVILLVIILYITGFSQIVQRYTAVFDSGATTGTTITFAKGIFLSAVVAVDSLSDSLYFQTYDTGVWTNITSETGAVVYYKMSTTLDVAVCVDPKYFYAWKIIRPRTTDKPVKSRSITIIGKQYQ
jgi:hypothetical protein